MRAHSTYKHESALDTALYIHKVQYVGAAYIKVRASLHNIRNDEVYETASFTIRRSELSKWRAIE